LKHALFSLGTIALAAGFFFLLRSEAKTIAILLGLSALFLPIFWLVVSTLRPALPERTCPSCKEESLRLLTAGEKTGVRCPLCGFSDPELYVPFLIDVDDDL